MTNEGGDDRFLLSAMVPGRAHWWCAAFVSAGLVGVLFATVPHARNVLYGTEVLLPAYAAASVVNEVITSVLLLALFTVQRSPAVLALAAGYLFSGLMLVPWVLSFPGVFAALGIDAGLQGTAAVAALRRIGFPLFVLVYAVTRNRETTAGDWAVPVERPVVLTVAAVVLAVSALGWLMVEGNVVLPRLMRDTRDVAALWRFVPATAIALQLFGFAILAAKRQSVLDLWVMVVLFTLLIETVFLAYLAGGTRFSVGWWAGRACGFVSASIVLIVLLSETTTLYARLARAALSERRIRESRLTTMEALSATIAHEINQPLASMVTNAEAGVRWLGRPVPDTGEALAALHRIARDGVRAAGVIDGIRGMFTNSTRERTPLDLNRVVEDALFACGEEAGRARIALRFRFDAALPAVAGNAVQLSQVVRNLVTNAVEAIGETGGGARLVTVRTALERSGSVVVSVADTGSGLAPGDADRIFEPFVTTKANGMGMGLMICRSIVESHGGRIWALDNTPQGTIFLFSLPCSGLPAVPSREPKE